jgi:cell division septal protein FtsQ
MALRSARPRQPLQSSRPIFPTKWKALVILVICSLTAAALSFYFWQPANELSCITNQNSYCDSDQKADMSALEHAPWLRSQNLFPQIEQEIIQKHQDVVAVHFRRTLPRDLEVEVIKANALFVATVNSQNWQVYDNGFLKSVDEPSLPLILFADEQTLRSLTSEQHQQLAYLSSKVQNLTPRWKQVSYLSSNQIEAEIENRGKVLLKLGDNQSIDSQLATLQSFLRSSTMDQDYKALDLRFEGLAVVKE